jgi:plasmid stability protein
MSRGDFPSAKQDQYMVRFPEGLRDRIKEEAAKSGRSMNAEIILRLEATFPGDEMQKVAGMLAVFREHEARPSQRMDELIQKVETIVEMLKVREGRKKPEEG